MIPKKKTFPLCWSNELSALLREITSKHRGDLYCLNCLHSFTTENNLKSHEKARKNQNFYGIVSPQQKNIIFDFNQYMKLYNIPFNCCLIFLSIITSHRIKKNNFHVEI